MINFSKRPASALLLTFFLMTLLIIVGIGVSILVIKDIRTVRTVVGGAQARYAAEGMTERGLKILKDELPGYEVDEDLEFTSTVLASLEIDARDRVVPCPARFEENDDLEWRRLSYNESVQLPLFASSELGEDKLENFYVQFYVGDEEGNSIIFPSDVDVLRWKILGILNSQTEAISEFIPVAPSKTSRENPTIFGSYFPAVSSDDYAYAKYSTVTTTPKIFYPHYALKTFLDTHNFNYLVMTNVVQAESAANFYIYFRLFTFGEEPVCEYVTLKTSADSEFGEARQSIETVVKEGENLPVFDFVLYHTKNKEVEEPGLNFERIPFPGSVVRGFDLLPPSL